MKKILVVDDDRQNIIMLEKFLIRNKYAVITAGDGKQALEIAARDKPDLVLSDILMPVMDGFTLCRLWKKNPDLKSIPFIFYTATYTDEKDEAYAISLGAEKFLRKPLPLTKLIGEIHPVIDSVEERKERVRISPVCDEEESYKQYSERLVRKLEKKLLDLENEINAQKQMDAERQKLQEQLLKAQKMESIGVLAGGIAHDFNNILSAVIGYSEIAWEQAGDALAVRESLKEVLQASRRAKDLVAQILAFSRQVEQAFVPVQIQLIIKEVRKLLRASLPSNITIETDINSFASVMAETGQIHQVLMNLCTNAYQSMNDRGGVLTLKLNEIEHDQSSEDRYSDLKPGKYLEVIVKDTGCGMDEATMSRIFDPYFSTKSPDEGTGLGLSVVFGIVKSHGGMIDVDSKIGHGSTFRILLPVIKKAATSEIDDFLASAECGNERILFVDDELLLAKMAKQTLEPLGYDVHTKTNSVEALELFQARPDDYDLLITDMMMPHMTGERLAGEILKIRPEMPMIICTGFSERIDQKEALEFGFKAFVRKPWRKAEMTGAIRKALEK